MKTLLLPLIVLAAVVLLAAITRQRWTGVGSTGRFGSKPLMTENEKEFYRRLRTALPEHEVFAQVAMGALLRPVGAKDRSDYHGLRGRFAQKIIDFVICDRSTLEPVAIVELDDRTHRVHKDVARDEMLTEAGYRVLRWDSRSKPSPAQIAAAVTIADQKAAR